MNPEIVTLQGVTKTYTSGAVNARALAGIDVTIQKGEFATLCGPSGSGKTTLLNLIGGLDFPTTGDVWLEGEKLSSLTRADLAKLRRDRIGFIFQAYNLIPTLTAIENAEFVLFLQNYSAKERRQKAMSALKEVGLEGLENRRPHEMSGGQQQRVAIARAIIHNPAIVLADEPTSNVDSATADSLLELMERLNHENGVTFLFSTHDQRVIDRAHRIIEIRDGKIVSDRLTPLAGAV